MDRLEQDLRDTLTRQAGTPPPWPPLLADAALRRGKRARRRRVAVTAGGLAAVVGLAFSGTSLLPSAQDRSAEVAAATITGAPRIPVFVPESGELIDWVGGEQRVRTLDVPASAVAQVPSGLLLVVGGAQPGLALLGAEEQAPRTLTPGLQSQAVAVSDDGRRATVVVSGQPGPQLQEIELPSGQILRSVPLTGPLAGPTEPVTPVAYSADAVLVNVGEGARQRTVLWERGRDGVVGLLDGVIAAVGGTGAGFSDDEDAVGGRAAFTVADERCPTEVHELRNGGGSPWQLCSGSFGGFSLDGETVLAVTDEALHVHDAEDGELLHTWQDDRRVGAHAWESDDTVLYPTQEGGITLIVRCSIQTRSCSTPAELANIDGTAAPVRGIG